MYYFMPVSYTHLDVYKRQVLSHKLIVFIDLTFDIICFLFPLLELAAFQIQVAI